MIRFFTAGESHGPTLTAIVDGLPAGLALTAADIDPDLTRRQEGFGKGGRMGIEKDHVRLSAGVVAGHTTGAPITLHVENRDYKNWAEKDIPAMTTPRPGHADLTGAVKYGYRELRLALERSSARETTMRVAVGAVCKKFLAEFGITVQGYVSSIGTVTATLPYATPAEYAARFQSAEESDVRCPDPVAGAAMREAIAACMQAKDTLGGVIEVVALHVPPGLGSHVQWDRKLDGRLMGALGSVHAVKGVEIGLGFAQTELPGTQVHDEIFRDESGLLYRKTNRAGGLEGGITTGEPLICRVAVKPIATTLNPLHSVDLATGDAKPIVYERSDFCPVPRGVPIMEAMVAIILADALMEKLGGDSIPELRSRFTALRRNALADLPMDNATWRFGYEYP
jgi:chorismate synthase